LLVTHWNPLPISPGLEAYRNCGILCRRLKLAMTEVCHLEWQTDKERPRDGSETW